MLKIATQGAEFRAAGADAGLRAAAGEMNADVGRHNNWAEELNKQYVAPPIKKRPTVATTGARQGWMGRVLNYVRGVRA